MTNSLKLAARKKALGIQQQTNSSRRPGRPRKNFTAKKTKKSYKGFNGLDLLHAQTVLSISTAAGVRLEPAPGCCDQKLDTSSKVTSVPNVVIRDSSPFLVSDLDALLNTYRQQLLQFLAYMQTPQYKEKLQQQIEEEKVCGSIFRNGNLMKFQTIFLSPRKRKQS